MSPANANIHPQAKRKMKEGKEEDQVAGPHYVKRMREEENRERTQFMDLSDDCFFEIFPYLGLAERINLRRIGNVRLAQIEKKCKFHYDTLEIYEHAKTLVCDGVRINMDEKEMKEELEMLGNTSKFKHLCCSGSFHQGFSDPYESIKADTIQVHGATNEELSCVFSNRKTVLFEESPLDKVGAEWIYKGMLNRELDVKYVAINLIGLEYCYGMMMGILDWSDEENDYVPRENQEITRMEDGLIVREKHLKITFADSPTGNGGMVIFRSVR